MVIDGGEAESRASQVIAGSSGGGDLSSPPSVIVASDGSSVTVELIREVPFGLIRILALDDQQFVVSARAVAYPYAP